MARYIDADALQKDGWVLQRYVCEDGCAFIERREIDQMPTIEARPVVRGEWIKPYINFYGHPCHCCSVCGFKASWQDKNFCPECGAEMRAREEQDES